MFANPEIAVDDLPNAEDLDWQPLHPDFVKVIRMQASIVLTIIAIAFAVPLFIPPVPGFIGFLLYGPLILIGGLILAWPSVAVPHRGYVLRDRDILFRKGVVWRSVTAVPFNRIQHVETSNTPFDRRYGLATLQLFTAGGSGADLKIEGLGDDIAERLRATILEKAGAIIEEA